MSLAQTPSSGPFLLKRTNKCSWTLTLLRATIGEKEISMTIDGAMDLSQLGTQANKPLLFPPFHNSAFPPTLLSLFRPHPHPLSSRSSHTFASIALSYHAYMSCDVHVVAAKNEKEKRKSIRIPQYFPSPHSIAVFSLLLLPCSRLYISTFVLVHIHHPFTHLSKYPSPHFHHPVTSKPHPPTFLYQPHKHNETAFLRPRHLGVNHNSRW